MAMTDTILFAFIVGCEVGFWVFLLSGLAVRYIFNLKKLSTMLLLSVPLVDIVLLAATTFDLSRGSIATFAHGLAAAYIGFSVAFGSITVQWMDTWFAHKFAGGQAPASAPKYGWALIRYEWMWWLRCVLSVGVTLILVYAAILIIDDPVRTEALDIWLKLPWVTVVPWFLCGPLWVMLFNRKAPVQADTNHP